MVSHYPTLFYICQSLFLLTWRTSFSCSWCEYQSTLVPGLLSTVLPLLLHPPQGTPQIELHIYIDDINNISRLVWYSAFSLIESYFLPILALYLCPVPFWYCVFSLLRIGYFLCIRHVRTFSSAYTYFLSIWNYNLHFPTSYFPSTWNCSFPEPNFYLSLIQHYTLSLSDICTFSLFDIVLYFLCTSEILPPHILSIWNNCIFLPSKA